MATGLKSEVDHEAMSAEELLLWAHGEFGDRLCLTCSWQKQSSVLVHMVSELGLGVDVIELDTHLFFRESYETRERLVKRYGIELIQPEILTIADQHQREGPNLWERDPDRCCWDEKRVWAYITVNEIPYNPLHDVGYRSIGCIPCTRPISPDEEERAGRWAGSDKLECGIHLEGPTT